MCADIEWGVASKLKIETDHPGWMLTHTLRWGLRMGTTVDTDLEMGTTVVTDLEMGTTSRESMPVWGLWDFCFTKPGSMTYTTPSTVMLVSAMLVATMTRRQLGGPGANTLACDIWSNCPQELWCTSDWARQPACCCDILQHNWLTVKPVCVSLAASLR